MNKRWGKCVAKKVKRGTEVIKDKVLQSQALTHNDASGSVLSSLIDSLPLNVYAKNREGQFIFANSCYCKSTGKNLGQILGTNDFDIHPVELARKYRTDDENIMQSGKTATIEEEWRSIGGEQGFVRVIKSPLIDRENPERILGTIGIFWDITDRKLTEIALAEEKNLLRTLIDNLPNYIYVKDRESRFLLGNKAVAKIIGESTPENLIGKTDFDYFPDELAQQYYGDDLKVIHEGKDLVDKQERLVLVDGDERWALTSKFPLKNLDGEVTGLVGMGHDITERIHAKEERKKLEAQLHHSQKMETVGTLAAGIAHDFNNLLNVINGYTELLLLGTIDESKHSEILQKIQKAGTTAAALVSQLTAFSSKQVVQPRTVNFNDILQNTLRMLQRTIGEKIEIQLNLAMNLWHVKIDPMQADQIIVNLATNARDAMVNGGILRLETKNIVLDGGKKNVEDQEPSGEYIQFSSSDNGCGIEKELQERVFEPFFTTKEKHKGTGLGLATIFGIVQQNGGFVSLDSMVGQGSTFTISLPRSSEPLANVEENSVDMGAATGSGTVLVAEDEQDVRDLVGTVLSEFGFKVHGVSSGMEALQFLKSGNEEIRLLLTDVVMPGMSGKELADEVASQFPGMKVLFMSGYTDHAIDEYDLAQAGTAFIQKPFEASQLLLKIQGLLGEERGGDSFKVFGSK